MDELLDKERVAFGAFDDLFDSRCGSLAEKIARERLRLPRVERLQ